MEFNIVYQLPFDLLKKSNTNKELGDILVKTLYSALSANAYFENEITLYADFNGMAIFSVLPFNFKIVYSNSMEDFKIKTISRQIKTFLLLNEKHIFKDTFNFTESAIGINDLLFIDDYLKVLGIKNINQLIIPTVIVPDSIFDCDITVESMHENIKDFSPVIYNTFMDKINKFIVYPRI